MARKVWKARNYGIISPLGMKSFLNGQQTEKFLKKFHGISLWYLRNTACTNFAAENTSVTSSKKDKRKK